jgi:hypothetical protein
LKGLSQKIKTFGQPFFIAGGFLDTKRATPMGRKIGTSLAKINVVRQPQKKAKEDIHG